MEVECYGGGVLIFSYLILKHQLDHFGGLCDYFWSKFIGCRFDGPPIACKRGLLVAKLSRDSLIDTSEFIDCRFDTPPIAARLYLTNSDKRKKCKPPRSATDGALGRLQSNSTSMVEMNECIYFWFIICYYSIVQS